MKFDYDTKSESLEHVTAFIDEDGDLVIRDDEDAVCYTKSGSVIIYSISEFQNHLRTAKKVFRRGDALTITF